MSGTGGSGVGRGRSAGGRAFSSEVGTGSRQENTSNQESRAPFRFHRNGKGSGARPPVTTSWRWLGGAFIAILQRELIAIAGQYGIALVKSLKCRAMADRDDGSRRQFLL